MKLLTKATFLQLLAVGFTISAQAQLELTQIQFEPPRTESSNPSSVAEYNGKVYVLIRDGIVVWDLATETWEKKEVVIQSGFNSSYIGVINDKIITFPENVHDVENGVFGREPAILNPITFEIRGIKDINPNGIAFDRHLLTHNDKAYFLANDGVNGREVWVTDGTDEGTVMLHDMTAGSSGQSNIWAVPFLGKVIINYNRSQFWITDGTPSGTALLKDFGEFVPSLPFTTDQFTTIGDECFFSYSTAALGQVIWKTDGTSEGTVQLTDFSDYNFSGLPKTLGMNGELFAFGTESQVVNYPFRILKINLSTGNKEEMVYQEVLGSLTGVPKVIGTHIYYCIFGHSQSSGIYRFDGSVDGAEKLKSIPDLDWASGEPKTSDNGFFWVIQTGSSGLELWASDETEEGTFQVKDIDAGIYGGVSRILGIYQNTVFLSANDGSTGNEPWVSKGSFETTSIISDFRTTPEPMQLSDLKVAGENLFVNLNEGTLKPSLYKLAGNKLENILNRSDFQGKTYLDIESFKGKLYFGSYPDYQTLYPEDNLYHLFSFDGTNVSSVKAISGVSSGPKEFAVANDILFFVAGSANYGDEYWISDGTTDGTKMLKDINPGSAAGFSGWYGFSDMSGVANVDDKYYFSASGAGQGHELWKTDLTESGTVLLKEINAGAGHSYPMNLTVVGSNIFFTATEDGSNFSTWVSDGTELGTVKLVDHFGSAFFSMGGQTYFVTRQETENSSTFIFKIWETDGTAEGTSEVVNLGEIPSSNAPAIQMLDGIFYMQQSESGWSYNLLTATNQVVTLLENHPNRLTQMFVHGGNVYFFVEFDGLWVSDGYSNNTQKIYEGVVFPSYLNPQLTAYKDLLVFYNNSALWSLDLFKPVVELAHEETPILSGDEITSEAWINGSTSFELELFNKGYADITLTGTPKVTFSGPDAGDFSVASEPLPESIGINKSSAFTIEFTPTSVGKKQAALSIEINNGSRVITVALSGEGIKATPTIDFVEIAAKSILDDPFELSASVDSDQEISFLSSDSEILSIDGTTATINKAGTATITASVEENDLYTAASAEQSLVVDGVEQTITFDELPTKTFGDAPFLLSASASSELEVTFTSGNVSVASIEGNTVTIHAAGSAIITASQAGNDNYSSATTTQTLTVNKASQSITFPAIEAKTFGDAAFDLSASTSSGLGVSLASSDETVATVSGATVTILKAGSAVITASQTGNDNYLAAEAVEQSLTVNKANQSISFSPVEAATFGDGPIELTALSSTALPVTFSSSDPAVVSVDGNILSILKAGAVTLIAAQAGNDNYSAAAAEQSLTINKASQTIAFGDLPTLTTNDESIPLAAEATSGLPVTFTSADEAVAAIEGDILVVVGGGETMITASQEGNENYLAAADVGRVLVVEEVTGVENELTGKVSVYPNPVHSLLLISHSDLKEGEFTVSSISGQLMSTGQLEKSGSTRIQTKDLKEGIYLLTVSTPDGSVVYRFIKEN